MKITLDTMVTRARELTTMAKETTEFAEGAVEDAAIATARVSLAWMTIRRMRERGGK